ncbi:hypothetical protein [Roseospira visakhapatnamensis]|uniref:Acyl-CoA:6-aminopenicillanic acid acyl transferase n=1 Tax=Roseospira visakhapatnamensis TaxID=390880 RepID=A0A7W6RC21_9PROT|nr:hypothetical protein [Roseospira visakhapatnamensis]MBB4265138.1 hypothetical protein [Roseospira visakhapatnamensis]
MDLTALPQDLPSIPVVDVGEGGAVALAEAAPGATRRLLTLAQRTYTRPVLRLADGLCARWLARNGTAYADEVRRVAARLDGPGALALNLSHQWACTAAAAPDSPGTGEDGPPGVTLLRTLDWDMPRLGADMVVARMRGPAGAFLAVTWPGYVGVLTGLAPGRFAVALNQAPISGPGPRPLRWLRDRRAVWASPAPPPDHLLRHVLETCPDATSALHALMEAPACVPSILTLAGIDRAEAWTLEKDRGGTRVRQHPAVAANHWRENVPCHARGRDSQGRWDAMAAAVGAGTRDLAWLRPPILWSATRLAMEMNPARGTLVLLGLEGARPVTRPLRLREAVTRRGPADARAGTP